MKFTIALIYFLVLIDVIGAPPVVDNARQDRIKPNQREQPDDSNDDLDDLEYGRYLKEVVNILEKDPEFKKRIEGASTDDIKSGRIADYLSLVQHKIRSQLDEAKQREILRLRDLVGKKLRRMSERQRADLARADPNSRKMKEFLPQHIDHRDTETFNEADLERLIRHASRDLEEIDRKREEQFKDYELRKEYQRRAKLAKLSVEERQRLEQLHKEAMEQKKRHRKLNHPGSAKQMAEVWEKVDHLESQQFTPRSFFKLHDINGDGQLDEGELEAIMLKEAEKVYEEDPNADPVERQEEMDRMREHVMKEFDKNNDRMVSYEEFDRGMKAPEARNEQGWKSIEDQPVFSDQEFKNFSVQMDHFSTPIPRHQTPAPPTAAPAVPVAAAAAERVAAAAAAVPQVPVANQPAAVPPPAQAPAQGQGQPVPPAQPAAVKT